VVGEWRAVQDVGNAVRVKCQLEGVGPLETESDLVVRAARIALDVDDLACLGVDERTSRRVADGASLIQRIRELAEMREEWIAITTESRQRIADRSTKNFLAATLGDARAAIKLCSRLPYCEYPEYREWLQEAKQKLAGARKRSQAR